MFGSGGETQTAVSGQRIVWYQRSGQVSSSYILYLFRMEVHSSQIALFKSQHEEFDLIIKTVNDFMTQGKISNIYTGGKDKGWASQIGRNIVEVLHRFII